MRRDDQSKKTGRSRDELTGLEKISRKLTPRQTQSGARLTPDINMPKEMIKPQQQNSAIVVSDLSPSATIGWVETNEIAVMVPLPCSASSAVKSFRPDRLTSTCGARASKRYHSTPVRGVRSHAVTMARRILLCLRSKYMQSVQWVCERQKAGGKLLISGAQQLVPRTRWRICSSDSR
jgi:hypothetical protein